MDQNFKNKPVFTLSVTAGLLGIHPRTLMFYEREKLIIPQRMQSGRRLFSQADLSQLQFIRYLIGRKRLNSAGVRVVLALLEKAKKTYPTLKEEFFPDFEERRLI